MPTVSAESLTEKVASILTRRGVPDADARIVADCLVHADLRGVESHGVLRTGHYVRRIEAGSIDPVAIPVVTRTAAAAAIVDGADGLGHVAVHRAMETAIEMARESGVAFVNIINSSHCGAMSFYGKQASDAGLIGIALTQADPTVLAYGARAPFAGTNPICVAAPAAHGAPILLDMATSTVAGGHIIRARAEGRQIPAHWAVDADGQPTTDPHQVKYMTPLGGAKGYGLGVVVDLLTGVLGGGVFGPHVPPMYTNLDTPRRLCHLVAAIDPARFGVGDAFPARTAALVDEIHGLPPAAGFDEVLAPGEPEWRRERQRRAEGIPVPEYVWSELEAL